LFRCKPAHQWEYEFSGNKTPPIWLPVNVPCAYGLCVEPDEKGKGKNLNEKLICKRVVDSDMFDYIQSIWSYLQPSEFKTFARNNIVGAIMIFSAIFWIPISILISYIDRQRRQHVEKIRFQWPDYMSSFSYNNTYSSFGGGATSINADVLQQLKYASSMHNQSNGGSYALQVMNQLTHHILQDQVNKQQPTNMPTPRPDDFSAAVDFNQNSSNNKPPSPSKEKEPLALSSSSHQNKSHSKVLQKGLDARISWWSSSTRGSFYKEKEKKEAAAKSADESADDEVLLSKETSL
jgi:hypothetical protein